MTPRALITGITGQDGSYLAEILLAGPHDSTSREHVLRSRCDDVLRAEFKR